MTVHLLAAFGGSQSALSSTDYNFEGKSWESSGMYDYIKISIFHSLHLVSNGCFFSVSCIKNFCSLCFYYGFSFGSGLYFEIWLSVYILQITQVYGFYDECLRKWVLPYYTFFRLHCLIAFSFFWMGWCNCIMVRA